MSEAAAPNERFQSIDAVRGFAVLGILLMNIVGMGMPAFAYIDPTYYGAHGPADYWAWAVNNVLTDGKMRSLFTMLFGASTVLIATRAVGQEHGPWRTHYSRMFWLLAIGMAHAYLLWWGDILVCYALAGLVIFPFRKLNAVLQIVIGVAVLGALMAVSFALNAQLHALQVAASAPDASEALRAQWAQMSFIIHPPAEILPAQLAGFSSGLIGSLPARAEMAQIMQLQLMPFDSIPEAIGQMFIGMGLFRLGFFTLKWSSRAYGIMIAVGYGLAAPVTAWLAWMIWRANFEPMTLHTLELWQAGTRTLIALAHASVLLLIVRSGAVQGFMGWLAAAGRMAFSNYLMSSIITVVLFSGLGLYGDLSRSQLLIVVAGVWAFILLWSKPWLDRFHYGPFEWLWRSLVKLKPQPFVKGGAPQPATA